MVRLISIVLAFIMINIVAGVIYSSSVQNCDSSPYDLNHDCYVNALDLSLESKHFLDIIPTYTPIISTPTPVPSPTATPIATRDRFAQPFASTSIWNMPIGSGAVYADANIHCCSQFGVFLEQIYIFNNPNAPLTNIMLNNDAWSGGSRCAAQGGVVMNVPLPAGFIIAGASSGNTPNNPGAYVTQDGLSYSQSQPITHCTTSDPWTSLGADATVSLYGDGIPGSQGGSHLSSAGGTIRLGEFASGVIPHAMKIVLDSSNYNGTFRWPALSADSCAPGCYTGSNPKVKMGTLLALPRNYDCNTTLTTPAKIICQALKDYGTYIVDSGWDPAYLPVEYGPQGNVPAEFQSLYGFSMGDSSTTDHWATDWRALVQALQVVDNNSSTSIGGGGSPVVPLAPPLK